MPNRTQQAALLLFVSGSHVSAFFPPVPLASQTCWTSRVWSSSRTVARSRAHFSTSSQLGVSSTTNVNLVVPGSRRRRRGSAPTASAVGMVAGLGSSEQQAGVGGRETDGFVFPEYGLPPERGVELVRLDMTEIPVDRVQSFVRNWAKRRVGPDVDRGWQGTVRLAQAGPKYGVPHTDMPVSYSRSNLGATLSFDGSPTDIIKIEVYYLRRGGSCVMVTRGVDGLAKLGGMGPQIAALVRHSEKVINEKLQDDLASFADDYHQRVLKGLAPAAEPFDEEDDGMYHGGAEGGDSGGQQHQATVLADGTIDVSPPTPKPPAVKRKEPPAPWKDGSAPPPMERMEDTPGRVELPTRAPAEPQGQQYTFPDVPDINTLFDEVDKPKLDAEVFELFKTMEKGERGEERVAGAESKAGAESFFADLRADNGTSEAELVTLFEAGRNASRRGGVDQATIPLSRDLHQLEVMLGGDTGLRGGIDIFAGPPQPIGGRVGRAATSPPSTSSGQAGEGGGTARGTYTMFDEHGDAVLELTAEEMDALDEDELLEAMTSIDVLIGELVNRPRDMWNSITSSYSDLYLNRCYILAMRARIPKSSRLERDAMIATNQAAVNTVKHMAQMHQKLEMQQLEKIRDICEAALEDMDSLPDKIRYMKPLLDDKFVAYMGYAIQTEREAIEKEGLNPDREPSRWLQVLGVIQKGVMAELQKSVYKDVELISHVLRMKEPTERFALLNITISTLPSMYIRGFKRTATNIVDYFEAMGDKCMDQDLRSMVLEVGENLKVLMSEERMAVLTKEIDAWAAKKAVEDSTESKLRRLREYEAEDLALRRATASGLWNKQMHPDATMDTEEKAEIKKLTDALRGQNLLRTEKVRHALAAKGLTRGDDLRRFSLKQGVTNHADEGDINGLDDFDDVDDGSYTDEDDLRRKLNRLAGPGGAMEAESREAPHLFSPGGPLESPEMARALGGPAFAGGGSGNGRGVSFGGGIFGTAGSMDMPNLSELEEEVAAEVEDMSDIFSDAKGFSSDFMPRPPSVVAEEEEEGDDTGDGWGSFDDDDWREKSRADAGSASSDWEVNETEEGVIRPRDPSVGEDVPGLLGGARFRNLAEPEGVDAGVGGEVRDEAARSADR